MTFHRARGGGFELRGIQEPFRSLLRELPAVPEQHAQAAAGRLFPKPAEPESDPEIAADWDTLVRPDLERLFASAREIVARDLASLEKKGAGSKLAIPSAHVEAWIHALTQARLALAEAHHFTEGELSEPFEGPFDSPRARVRLQMDFYAALLEWLVSGSP